MLAPLARRSLDRYAEIAADPPTPFFLDPEPLGTLAVTIDEDEVGDLREWVGAARAVGVEVERVDDRVRELEPELSPDVLEAYLLREGYRVDPLALTVCFGALARAAGAAVLHHAPARRLLERGDRVAGVVTDDAVIEADAVVLAAGPWSPAIARPIGVSLPIASARGWLVHVLPERPLFGHWIQSGARRLHAGGLERADEPGPLSLTLREFGEAAETREISPMIQPAPDGSVLTGTSREPSFAADPFELDVPRLVAAEATRLVPALADAPVLAAWSGVRPVSPDERPMLGPLREGLFVATGHGSEGVILGAASAEQLAALVLGNETPFENAPFDPGRFD